MSKVKHFLRKLHIGDHHHHGRPPALDPSPQSSSSQPSPSFDLPQTAESGNSADGGVSFFEEEFEIQLALAISASDQGRSGLDSETAQIDAAKKISLGRAPSQNLGEFQSLRYWGHDVLNYDEKVIDGFYDVCGMDSKLDLQSRIPSVLELEKVVPLLDDICHEVVLVNRLHDVKLRKLEESVYLMLSECYSLDKSSNIIILAQKIAHLIVEKMGGPVVDVEDMSRRWRERSQELRICLNTVILPLGSLDFGLSRQRALLFKVLADRINLPCKLVKGSYYTGTDEGAVNLIKLDDGSEYIIDLMGAPGAIIPSELSCPPNQNMSSIGSDASNIIFNDVSSSVPSDPSVQSFAPAMDGVPTVCGRPSASSVGSNGEIRTVTLGTPVDMLKHDYEVSINRRKQKSSELSSAITIQEEFSNLLNDMRSCDYGVDLIGKSGANEKVHFDQNQKTQIEHLCPPFQPSGPAYNEKLSENALGENFRMLCEGAASSSNVLWQQNVLLGAKNESASNDGNAIDSNFIDVFENAESLKISSSNESSANRVHDIQIASVLNGMAEILWEDLRIGERIGIGSYGEVYRAQWNDKEVAVKKFMNQDISGDALAKFKSEVEIMLRLRHPNIVLFMGAVTRPPNMSILTEFLPRGSLYKLLHRSSIQLDERRRIKMALDVAKGMNYLHTSHPIIVHRDLKTPNLLVDKNWVVKVCDFGMSRLQHHTFLSSKSAAGTAEWMAPEVLRNEPSNEKSDVYSFGVILWELATLQVPWAGLISMQVVGAVGFQGRHLEIPPSVDPIVASIISDCWNINTWDRPSFEEIIARLKCVRRLSLRTSHQV